eukprot:8629295-Pyramimonas_sp.AAC.1
MAVPFVVHRRVYDIPPVVRHPPHTIFLSFERGVSGLCLSPSLGFGGWGLRHLKLFHPAGRARPCAGMSSKGSDARWRL